MIFRILIVLFVFFASLQTPLDLDLGWHLRYGEHFFNTGHVLKTNTISYIRPDYAWVQASWGYDLVLYQLFSRGGFLAISVAGAVVTVLTFVVVAWPVRTIHPAVFFILAALFLTHTGPMYVASMRSQTLSTLLFALLVRLVEPHILARSRIVFVLPLLFLLWANLHGGFIYGLISYFMVVVVSGLLRLLSKTRFMLLIVVGLTSTLTPLLNPWGTRIYEESLTHATQTTLTSIGEWSPIPLGSPESVLMILVCIIIGVGLILRKTTRDIPLFTLFALSLFNAFMAIRFLANYGIVATRIGVQLATTIPSRFFRTAIVVSLFVLLAIAIDTSTSKRFFDVPNLRVFSYSWDMYCTILQECSEGVTREMRKQIPKGNGYNPYNYGGYLSFRVPEVKTFVDGRMAAWDTKDAPAILEGDMVFADTQPFTFLRYDARYHFAWMILPSDSRLITFLTQQKDTWELQYRDSLFHYFVRKHP